MIKRLIACQGSLQFITAVSVARFRAHEKRQSVFDDTLVVFDVDDEFFNFIKKLASVVGTWKKTVYLSNPQLEEASKDWQGFYEALGEKEFDELILCRNWQKGNELLLRAYPDALRVGYGDGIGYYFGPQRFQPLKNKQKILYWIRNHLPRYKLDVGYYLLPEIFGEKPPSIVKIPPAHVIRGLIEEIAKAFCSEMQLPIEKSSAVCIVLLGNFSASWTTLENEVTAYIEIVKQKTSSDTTLVLKPHPRNKPSELEYIKERFLEAFSKVVFLDHPLNLIPIEVLVQNGQFDYKKTQVIGFTTACIPLHVLYGIKSHIGLGKELLSKYFSPHQEHMLENEVLLNKALDYRL